MAIASQPKEIRTAGEVRFRKFTASDRRSPVFEVLMDETIILDIARRDGDDLMSEFEVGFHDGISGARVSVAALGDILRTGERLVKREEAEEDE